MAPPLFQLLIIEDNEDHLALMHLALMKLEDIRLSVASTIAETDVLLKSRDYDLIISNMRVSDGDAPEYFQAKGFHRKIPIILVTGSTDTRRAIDYLREGFFDYRVKSEDMLISLDILVKSARMHIEAVQKVSRADIRPPDYCDFLEIIFESTLDFLVLKDRNLVYRMVNPAFCRFLGMNKTDIIGKKDKELFTSQLAEKHMKADQQVLKTGTTAKHDICLEGRAGKVWHQVVKTPVRDSGQGITGLLCSSRNIHEQKQTEALLSSQVHLCQLAGQATPEQFLQATLDEAERLTDSRIGFFHLVNADRKTLSLQQWSTNTLPPEWSTKPFTRHYPIDHAGVWADCLRRRESVIHNDYNELSHPKGLLSDHMDITRELMVPVFEDDRIVAILGVGNKPGNYTGDDITLATGLANMAWDIIVRKKAREDRRDSSRQLQTLVDKMPCMVYRCTNDHGWTMEYISEGCLQLTGYDSEALINSRLLAFADIIHPDHQDRIWDEIQDALEKGQPFKLEYPIICKDNTEKWVSEWGQLAQVEGTDASILEGFITEIVRFNKK